MSSGLSIKLGSILSYLSLGSSVPISSIFSDSESSKGSSISLSSLKISSFIELSSNDSEWEFSEYSSGINSSRSSSFLFTFALSRILIMSLSSLVVSLVELSFSFKGYCNDSSNV